MLGGASQTTVTEDRAAGDLFGSSSVSYPKDSCPRREVTAKVHQIACDQEDLLKIVGLHDSASNNVDVLIPRKFKSDDLSVIRTDAFRSELTVRSGSEAIPLNVRRHHHGQVSMSCKEGEIYIKNVDVTCRGRKALCREMVSVAVRHCLALQRPGSP